MKQETAVETEIEPETASSNNFQPAPERKRNRGLSEDKRFKIFAGSANRQLAEEICKHVGVPLGETKIQRFADGEIYFQLLENVRGVDVFVVQPTCNPVDSEPGGAADHDRCAEARLRRPHHGRGAVLRLCPAGPQGPAACGDLVQAGGRSADHGGREPRAASWTCTQRRFRASSISRSITCLPAR